MRLHHLIDFADGFDSSGAALNIGWLNLEGGYHFQGAVDEVALYHRALSEIEIRSHYYLSRGYSEMCTDPIADYASRRFDYLRLHRRHAGLQLCSRIPAKLELGSG